MAEIKQIQVGSSTYDIRDASKLPLTGGTLSGNITMSNRTNGNQMSFSANNIESSPLSQYVWHDVQKFNKYGYTYEYTTDGTTWTTETSSNYDKWFCGRDNQSVTAITADRLGCRITIGTTATMSWSLVAAIIINYSYTAKSANTSVKIETLDTSGEVVASQDYTAGSYSIASRLLWYNSLNGNKSLRITILKTTNTDTGIINLSGIKCLSTRLGDQGLGCEYEYPYQADTDKKIYPWSNNAQDLGTSSYKWKNVYATTFIGNVTGNCSGSSTSCTGNAATATSATKATQDASGNVITTTYATKTYVDNAIGTAISTSY